MPSSRLAQQSRPTSSFGGSSSTRGCHDWSYFVAFFSLSGLMMGYRILFNALFITHPFIQRHRISISTTQLNNQPETLGDLQIYSREHLHEESKLRTSEYWIRYREHFRIEALYMRAGFGIRNWTELNNGFRICTDTESAILVQCWLYRKWQSHSLPMGWKWNRIMFVVLIYFAVIYV
jgi:hypothetical protein